WGDLARYVTQVRGLLRGDVVEVDGAACQLLYSPGFGPRPPIDVPLLVAPAGPKGFAVAHEVADGVVLVGMPPEGEGDPRAASRATPLLDEAGAALLGSGWTGYRASVRARLDQAEAAGATEVIYTPAGPDIARELEAFASAAHGDE